MSLALLYSFRRCPYAIRARLALRRAGVTVELREIVLPDGRVLEQSLDIMQWALRQHDPEGWLTAAAWPAQQALIACNDGEFKALLDRYKYPQRHPEAAAAAYRDAAL